MHDFVKSRYCGIVIGGVYKMHEEIIAKVRDYKVNTEDENIWWKEKVKRKLINNQAILYYLHNTELDIESADEFIGKNIRPALMIPETQDTPINYICFKTSFSEVSKYNKIYKYATLTFVILCDQRDLIDKESGIARHDILGALIREEFNWSNMFGTQLKLVSNEESTTDTEYATRTLKFQSETVNGISQNNNIINYQVTV